MATAGLTVADLQGDKRRRRREHGMRRLFQFAAVLSVVIGAVILIVLIQGAIRFMNSIDWSLGALVDDNPNPGWYPRRDRFDFPTIIIASAIVGAIAMVVAVPFGLGAAIYLSEYAHPRVRSVVKPVIEVLAGIPSVVVGFFALKYIAPDIVTPIFNPVTPRNMLVAGLGIGILVIPIMASVSEDALRAVPGSLREASYGVGAKQVSTTTRIVLPAAVSGLVAAFIIAISRAIGETMVATMAGGLDGSGPRSTDPLEPGLTMTAAMTNAAGGTDQVQGGAAFQVLFMVGLVLFLLTGLFNLVGDRFVRRVRMKY